MYLVNPMIPVAMAYEAVRVGTGLGLEFFLPDEADEGVISPPWEAPLAGRPSTANHSLLLQGAGPYCDSLRAFLTSSPEQLLL